MELYSFNQDKILNNYNKLLELYNNATSEEEKIKIYSNLKSLSRYIMHKKNQIIEPKNYKEELSQRRKQIISSVIELDSLTRELCYYWSNNLYQITSFHNSFLSSFRINKEEYLNRILTFIKENFSEDLSLVKRTFDEGKIQVKKSLIMSKSEMYIFEMLNDFYINIRTGRTKRELEQIIPNEVELANYLVYLAYIEGKNDMKTFCWTFGCIGIVQTLKKKKSANKVKSLSKGETIPVKQIDPDDIEISILNISQLEKNNVSQTEKSNRNSSSNDVTNIASPFNNDNSSIEQKNDISDIKLSFEYNIKDILYRKKKDLIDRAEYLMKEENLSHYTTEIYFTNKKGSSYILSRLLIIGKQLIVVKEKKQNKEPKELTEIKPNRKLSNVIPYTMKDIELFYSPLLLLNFDLITAKLYINQKKHKLIIYVLGSKKYFKIKFKSKDIFKSFSLIINDRFS